MVPRHFTQLSELPLNSNGKVDRGKLNIPSLMTSKASSSSEGLVQPLTDMETNIHTCFCEILGVNTSIVCCENGSFFRMGGNSVTAIQFIALIKSRHNYTVTIQEFFRYPTVYGVRDIIQQNSAKNENQTVRTNEIKGNGYEILCLQVGSKEQVPLLLFNPAGSSGLW
jgi:hypothetical protein